jgi:hypothetical protein
VSFEQRLEKAHTELQSHGVWLSNYKPPVFSLLRALGIKVAPPYYLNFHLNAIIHFWYFAPIIFLAMYFGILGDAGAGAKLAMDKAAFWGILYGLGMSLFYLVRRKQLKLRSWSDF